MNATDESKPFPRTQVPLTVKEAQRRGVCRFCHKPESATPDNHFILNYGSEFAHANCIEWANELGNELPMAEDKPEPWVQATERCGQLIGEDKPLPEFEMVIREACRQYAAQQTKELQSLLNDYSPGGTTMSDLQKQLATCRAEVERLKECLEPGKASAIVNGLFREAERLGFYRPTAKHALTQFVEYVEQLRAQLATCRAALERLRDGNFIGTPINRDCGAMMLIEQALESAGPPK